MTSHPQYPTGWLCPRCNTVNSPAVTCCQCGQRTFQPPPPSPWHPDILPVQPTRTNGEPPPGHYVYCGGQDVERYSTRPPAA